MKSSLCLLVLIFANLGNAVEKPYFTYGNVHAMGGYPMIGAGVRAQKGIHAFDFSGNICPLKPPHSFQLFHVRSLYLVYPKQTGLYFGGGLGILNDPETIQISGSFESTMGFQWGNRIFLEANPFVPFKNSFTTRTGKQVHFYICPGLTFGFGF